MPRNLARKLLLATVASIAFSPIAMAQQPPAAAGPATAPVDSVAITINGQTIKASEVDKESVNIQRRLSQEVSTDQLARMMPQIRQSAITNIVSRSLLSQAVVDNKVTVSPEELNKAVEQIKQSIPPNESLDSVLARAGLTTAEFTRQVTDNLGIQKLLADQSKNATVSDDDVKKFYDTHPEQFRSGETVSARHILVAFGPGDDAAKKAEKRKKIDGIRDRLLKGEDFAKLCAEFSDDPGSKNTGGLYENFTRGKMVPPFENAAFTQKVGEIGPVVETDFGYHVLKVENHIAGAPVPLDTVKERLKSFLDQKKKQDSAQDYVKKLHDAANIQYAAGYAPPTTAPSTQPTTAPSTQPAK